MGIVATPVASPKASNSSRVSSRSKRVSNTSHVSNRATTDAFSEDDDDLGMLSVSARASRSSQIAPENESELELLATDQTQLQESFCELAHLFHALWRIIIFKASINQL